MRETKLGDILRILAPRYIYILVAGLEEAIFEWSGQLEIKIYLICDV